MRDRLPANAVLITVWQSGSMRFHAGREIVMWDSLDPAWLDRAITWLRSQGLQPYLLFERREEPEFRARFRGESEVGAPRLAAAIRSEPPGQDLTIRPIARGFWRASHIRPKMQPVAGTFVAALASQHPVAEKNVDRVDGAFADDDAEQELPEVDLQRTADIAEHVRRQEQEEAPADDDRQLVGLQQFLQLADVPGILALDDLVHVDRFREEVTDRRRDPDAGNRQGQQDPRVEKRHGDQQRERRRHQRECAQGADQQV